MPDPLCSPDRLLQALGDRDALFGFLRDVLRWNVEPQNPFTYDVPEVAGRAGAHLRLSQIVPFTGSDPFPILLVEFEERFRRGDLRDLLRGVRKQIREKAILGGAAPEELIFVCTLPGGVRFVRFEERENRQARLRVFGFDTDTVRETHTLRSVNLPQLVLTQNVLGEPDWDACRKNWDDAWDVERVTKEFFRDYKQVFETVRDSYIGDTAGDKQLFTQRWFNRLMFIHFLSKKGWLEFNGRTDYLFALRDAAQSANENVYRDRLYWAFFDGLGVGEGANAATQSQAEREERRGKVPYLNGGLFEMADADDVRGAVTINNAALDLVLSRLFGCYNFTIAESSPDDADVAVDPEMLGKVFEELVNGRHETGSYYTPRPVVQFMCREVLKGYLAPLGTADAIARFVDFGDADGITDGEAVLAALKRVTVVDPACGSGAYLLGMLQELMALRLALFQKKRLDDASAYRRKLEIIQNNLFGADLDPFAVNTARLRLWLSLVVEDARNPLTDPAATVALPNLDFKIEIGDSVSCPDPTGGLGDRDMFRETDLRTLSRMQRDYGGVQYPADKKPALKREIDALARSIKRASGLAETAFDWRVDFGAVFEARHDAADLGGGMNLGGTLAPAPEPGGFDIVLANPPYVRGELIPVAIKSGFARVYAARYAKAMDLYCVFYYRAIELLKPGGQLVFITPNKWFRAGYGEKLRAHIAATCRVRSITDFGELPVFQNVATFPMIFHAAKETAGAGATTFTQVKTLAAPYPNVRAIVKASGFALPATAIAGKDWSLTASHVSDRLRTMERAGVPLGEYVAGKIYYGIKTGFNVAFVIKGDKRKELIDADPRSEELIKPLAVGDDVRRWRIEKKDKWLIFTRRGVDIEKYPAVKAHLERWKAELTPKKDGAEVGRKPGSYKWYEIQDEVAYHAAFDKPKIVFPDIAKEPRFMFDTQGVYLSNTAYIVAVNDSYLCGVLNSQSMWNYCKEKLTVIGDAESGGRLRFFRAFVEHVPIPAATPAQKAEIASLVQVCLDRKGQGVADIEADINARVAALYGL